MMIAYFDAYYDYCYDVYYDAIMLTVMISAIRLTTVDGIFVARDIEALLKTH